MIVSPWNNKRRVVPRWRSLRETLRTSELAISKKHIDDPASNLLLPEYLQKLENWRRSPSLLTASEVMESAVVCGREFECLPAARQLVFSEVSATPAIKKMATLVLRRSGLFADLPDEDIKDAVLEKGQHRALIRINPTDALAWVDLALRQTIDGYTDHALRSIRVALQLAPNNRHVLRSAARLYLHAGDPSLAYDLIARSPATKFDPWLIAAEISLAELAQRRPKYVKQAIAYLGEGKFLPRHISEAAAAVATLELVEGNRRKARKHFSTSMLDPTGNTLAQAEWASPQFGDQLVSDRQLQHGDEKFEANAFHHFLQHEYREVVLDCYKWAEIEEYSVRPYEFGAVAASTNSEFNVAIAFCKVGLKKRPQNTVLLNTYAFSLASLGDVAAAERVLSQIPAGASEQAQSIATANHGLIHFRNGEYERGRTSYLLAIRNFEQRGEQNLATLARYYFAKEAISARLADAKELLFVAKQSAEKMNSIDAKKIKEKIGLLESQLGTNKGC